MNKQNISNIPDENKIGELLGKMQSVPSGDFHKKMERSPWRNKNTNQKSSIFKPRLKLAIATIVILLLTTLAISPQGRAWAQEAFQFFKQVDFTSIPLTSQELEWFNAPDQSYELPLIPVYVPTPPPDMASLPGCDTGEKAQAYACQISYAESRLGFDLMELPEKPKGLEFRSVHFDTIEKSATIGYGTSYDSYGMSLRLIQRFGQAPEQYGPWDWVPAGKVEKIKTGNFDGEYVSGTFSLPAGSDTLEWSAFADMEQRIAWSDGTFWYLLETSMSPHETGYLERDQFIDLASSLVEKPVMQEEKLSQYSLNSISQAEEVSGLDLKAPTLLPLGFDFSYAGYYLFNNEVQIRYDGNGYMVIHEWAGKSLDFESLSTTYSNYEIVKVNGRDAFYGLTEGSSPYLLLWWNDGDLNYQMFFYWYSDGIHGVINKEKMITIAESMDDINVYKSNLPRPYEYVNLYERALDMNIQEFPTTPTGWSYDDVWADSYSSCISLRFISTNLKSRLFTSECRANPFDDYYDIPRSAVEKVKIGKITGQYIVGWFGIDENGATIWQPDQLQKSLFWKEDGHWLRIVITGESATTSNKEDLIQLAESLK